MMRKATYRAARTVAPIVENYFTEQLSAARQQGDKKLAPVPSAKAVEAIIDTAFWASLRREEGYSPRISLAFFPPELVDQPLLFEQPLPLNSYILTKLGPGVERPGIHLGIWQQEGGFYIWGTSLQIPDLCFVLDVPEPGLLVVKHRRSQEFGKFSNVAVLIGDQVKVIDNSSSHLPDCPGLLSSLLGLHSLRDHTNSVLVQLAVSMRRHQHGGTLLVVPAGNDQWRQSILQPVLYKVQPAFLGLAQLVSAHLQGEESQDQRKSQMRREVENIAGLTAIDGATLLSDQYELLAFGAKIKQRQDGSAVEKVLVTEPVLGEDSVVLHPSLIGGTRHLSAAQFVHDQRGSLAMVASQDGRFTVFTWSACEHMVQSHRIDVLLL